MFDKEIEELLATEDGWRELCAWAEADLGCGAPTGAPDLLWLREQGALRGYASHPALARLPTRTAAPTPGAA